MTRSFGGHLRRCTCRSERPPGVSVPSWGLCSAQPCLDCGLDTGTPRQQQHKAAFAAGSCACASKPLILASAVNSRDLQHGRGALEVGGQLWCRGVPARLLVLMPQHLQPAFAEQGSCRNREASRLLYRLLLLPSLSLSFNICLCLCLCLCLSRFVSLLLDLKHASLGCQAPLPHALPPCLRGFMIVGSAVSRGSSGAALLQTCAPSGSNSARPAELLKRTTLPGQVALQASREAASWGATSSAYGSARQGCGLHQYQH